MKKIICTIMAALITTSAFCTNAFAIQDDVKAAYINELKWICSSGHTMWHSADGYNVVAEQCSNPTDVTYCVYDINKDGYKELCVKAGCCEADYIYKFYGCEYGKIVSLGTFNGGHSELYACDSNGVFVYSGHMGYEALYRLSKYGHSLTPYEIFSRDLNPLFAAGVDDPWSPPKTRLIMYDGYDYSGLY